MSNIIGITRGGAAWIPAFVTDLNQTAASAAGAATRSARAMSSS
jgi:hypothetical protein